MPDLGMLSRPMRRRMPNRPHLSVLKASPQLRLASPRALGKTPRGRKPGHLRISITMPIAASASAVTPIRGRISRALGWIFCRRA